MKISSIGRKLKDLLRKHFAESIIISTMSVSALKESVSLSAKEGRLEKVMTAPLTLLHAETRDETALMTEETGLLEEPTYDYLSPLEN